MKWCLYFFFISRSSRKSCSIFKSTGDRYFVSNNEHKKAWLSRLPYYWSNMHKAQKSGQLLQNLMMQWLHNLFNFIYSSFIKLTLNSLQSCLMSFIILWYQNFIIASCFCFSRTLNVKVHKMHERFLFNLPIMITSYKSAFRLQ